MRMTYCPALPVIPAILNAGFVIGKTGVGGCHVDVSRRTNFYPGLRKDVGN